MHQKWTTINILDTVEKQHAHPMLLGRVSDVQIPNFN